VTTPPPVTGAARPVGLDAWYHLTAVRHEPERSRVKALEYLRQDLGWTDAEADRLGTLSEWALRMGTGACMMRTSSTLRMMWLRLSTLRDQMVEAGTTPDRAWRWVVLAAGTPTTFDYQVLRNRIAAKDSILRWLMLAEMGPRLYAAGYSIDEAEAVIVTGPPTATALDAMAALRGWRFPGAAELSSSGPLA
jgi:hypothetical protein